MVEKYIIKGLLDLYGDIIRIHHECEVGVRDITSIPVYPDLGVLRYVSRYAFDVPVHSANSVNFRSIVHLLSFRAVFYFACQFLFNLA